MDIKRTLRDIVITSIIGLASVMPFKTEAKPNVNVDVAFKNKYLTSTGKVFEDEPVIQPFVTISGDNGFHATVGSNIDKKGLNELDYMVGYGRNVKGIDVSIGAGAFDLRNFGEDKLNDNFCGAWIDLSKEGLVSPSLTFNQNISGGSFDNPKGNLIDFALSYDGNVGKIPVSLNAHTQYNNRYFIGDSGLSVAQAEISVPLNYKGVSIKPMFRYQKAIDKDNFEDDSDFGLSLGYDF